ncbi:MAG: helix-turn-helix domain-containing protein, partial [Planctomycetes bacterium]|nr:helix-turn-helix domain-containing protein [Planctomycetota bacterium]
PADHAHAGDDAVRAHLARNGRATLLIDGQRVDLESHALVWVLPAQDAGWIARSPDFQVSTVVWPRALIDAAVAAGADALLAQPSASVLARMLSGETTRALAPLLGDLALQDDGQVVADGLRYALSRLWHAWRQAPVDLPVRAVHPAVANAARLLRHSVDALDASALGASVGLSADHLGRSFSEQLGVSLVDYRNGQCLDRLLASLHAGERNLELAARAAGFGSYAQFHRVFRRALGTSPRAFVARLADRS